MIDRAISFSEGWKLGWDKCRELMCKRYNLDEKEVIEWENRDKDILNVKEMKE